MRWLVLGFLPLTNLCWNDRPAECANLGDEIPGDGIDQDCDGEYASEAEALSSVTTTTLPLDATGDFGYTLNLQHDVLGDDDDSVVAPDLVVGWPGLDQVFVISGGDLLAGTTGAISSIHAANLVISSSDSEQAHYAGLALATGDVNADGMADLLVGARETDRTDDGQSGIANVGAVYLVPGPLDALMSEDLQEVSARVRGTKDSMRVGSALAIANLIGDDESMDLVLGAPGYQDSDPKGAVGLLQGHDGIGTIDAEFTAPDDCDADAICLDNVLLGRKSDWQIGTSLAAVPGYGVDDADGLLIGAAEANDGAGAAWLFMGEFDGELTLKADAGALELVSGRDEEHAGAVVASGGDVDADGLEDVLIGSQTASDGGGAYSGRVYLVLGATAVASGTGASLSLDDADTVLSWSATAPSEPCALSTLGDIDQDGRDDLAIGAPMDDSAGDMTGTVFVVPGDALRGVTLAMAPDGATTTVSAYQLDDAPLKLKGTSARQRVGWALAGGVKLGAPDASADATQVDEVPDLIVAAPGNQSNSTSNAALFLVLGEDLAAALSAN